MTDKSKIQIGTKFNEHDAFSIPIKFIECPFFDEINSSIKNEIEKLVKNQKEDIDSNVALPLKANLKESKFDFHLNKLPEIKKLFSWICLEVENVNKRLSPDSLDYKCHITESWYHVTEKGGHHGPHNHPNCSWCGIYYLQPGKHKSGVNVFHSSQSTNFLDAGFDWWREHFWSEPEEGKLVLFPSLLLHSAQPYLGDDQRIVISFNSVVHRDPDAKVRNAVQIV